MIKLAVFTHPVAHYKLYVLLDEAGKEAIKRLLDRETGVLSSRYDDWNFLTMESTTMDNTYPAILQGPEEDEEYDIYACLM